MHQLLYWKFEHLFTNDAVKLYKLITIFWLTVHIHNIFIEKKVYLLLANLSLDMAIIN